MTKKGKRNNNAVPQADARPQQPPQGKHPPAPVVTANAELPIPAPAPAAPRVIPPPPDTSAYVASINRSLEGGGLRWRADTPPRDGWYPAGNYCDPLTMAYWDGKQWSEATGVSASPEHAVKVAMQVHGAHVYEPGAVTPCLGTIFWADGFLDRPRATTVNRTGKRQRVTTPAPQATTTPPKAKSNGSGQAVRVKEVNVDIKSVLSTVLGKSFAAKPKQGLSRTVAERNGVKAPNNEGVQRKQWDLFDAAEGKVAIEHLPKIVELTGFSLATLRWNWGSWKRFNA